MIVKSESPDDLSSFVTLRALIDSGMDPNIRLDSFGGVDAVRFDPAYEVAVYNAACMRALQKNASGVIEMLEHLKVIGTDSSRRRMEKIGTDSDFDPIRDNDAFIEYMHRNGG